MRYKNHLYEKRFFNQYQRKIEFQKEEKISEKQALLIDLQGKHSLSSISGFSGANTMYDYPQEGSRWVAEGSFIHQVEESPLT